MKFLFLLHINLCKNGPSVHILTDILLFALKKNIYIDVICRGNKNDYDKLNSTIFNNRINFIPVPEKKVKKTRLFKRYLEEIRYARQTYNIYKKQNYDTVFLQSCSASYFFVKRLKKLNCPIVFNVQDIFPNNLFSLQRSKVKRVLLGPFRIIQKKGFLNSTKIITISDDMKETLCKIGVNSEKISVIYNWSYGDDQINQNVCQLFSTSKTNYNVVYAGNIGMMQNVEIVLKAASILEYRKNIHFYIIGDGVAKNRLISLYSNKNNVSFFPNQPQSIAESLYGSADLNVVPLMRGIIKTALPSKTATCLRSPSPVIFCIDEDSLFANLVKSDNNVYISSPDNENELANLILKIFGKQNDNSERRLVKECMSSVLNPKKYVEEMEFLAIHNSLQAKEH